MRKNKGPVVRVNHLLISLPFVLFAFSECGENSTPENVVPYCTIDASVDSEQVVNSFDPFSGEYQKHFYDSLLGEKDTAKVIDPTGTYHIGPYTPEGADEPAGNQGDVRVKFIGGKQIAVCLAYVSHGPGFNLGYLFDTLEYRNNTAVYHPYWDDACTITFRFADNGVDVAQYDEDPGFACEFGMNVYVSGFYNKESDKIQNIDDDCY